MHRFPLSAFLLLVIPSACLADWPQWRGPARDGIATGVDLPDSWPEGFVPFPVWQSDVIPSDHYGGHGSPVIADGRVYLTLVWHRDVPTPSRILNSRILSDLGFRTTGFTPEKQAKFEADRLSLSSRLRGAALDSWITEWMQTNLTDDEKLRLDGWIQQRFKLGKTAIPLADFELIRPIVDKELDSVEALRSWVAAQPWTDPATAEKVLTAVPNTKVVGADVALCLDLRDGRELWRFEAEGLPAGRVASVTPAVVDGKVYTALSTKVYCLDAANGQEVWSTAVGTKRGIATSPLVTEGLVIVHNGKLCALDAANGKEVWSNPDIRIANGSPVVWKDLVLCNTDHDLVAVELQTGSLRWKQPAGGDSTPVVSGDRCVVVGKTDGHSFAAYALSPEGARNLWTKAFTARRYAGSPVILGGHAYHFCSARHLCVDLETGETKWEVERQSNLSSPIFADGKFLVYENNGGFLAMIDADPAAHRILGRAKVSGLGCATPALDGTLAVVRTKDRLVCLDLSRPAPAP